MTRIASVLLFSVVLAGCASVPATPTIPLAGQPQVVVARDGEDCAQASRNNGPAWEACMLSRQYRVAVQVMGDTVGFVRSPYVTFDVEATREIHAVTADRDLHACKGAVRAAVPTGDKVTLALVGGTDPALLGNLEKVYRGCMAPRGFAIKLWEPPRETGAPPYSRAGDKR